MEKLNIPITGLIENMSGNIFGAGKVEKVADEKKINFLGSLELNKEITKSGDSGEPFVINNNLDITKSFEEITKKIISFCEK